MLEVSPLADVPRANLLRVCKRLKLGREPTDPENSTLDGNVITRPSKFVIWLVLYTVRHGLTDVPA
jgi:hypothetical protein